MGQTWDDAERDTLAYYAATDRTACRRASGGRRPRAASGDRRLPPAPQAIGRVLVLLASLSVVVLMCAGLWVGLTLCVTVLLRLLGP